MTLTARQLACDRGNRRLFRELDFELGAGDALWVRGSNGSGKTSLMRLLCGLAPPLQGEIRWRDNNIRDDLEEYRSELQYCGHESGVKDDLTAWENVYFAAQIAGKACSRNAAYEALEQIGLGDYADIPVRFHSQGQRRRVALAKLFLNAKPPLLLVDEPFNALDDASTSKLRVILEQHLAHGGIVVYTTHQEVRLAAQRLHELDLAYAESC